MISYGTNPACASDSRPGSDPRETSDAHERSALEKALRYMALEPGQPIIGKKWTSFFSAAAPTPGCRTFARPRRFERPASGVGRSHARGARSQSVRSAAEREGLHNVFLQAGAEWREPAARCASA